MPYSVEIIADSKHPETGGRLTTMLVRYPRFSHADFIRHRLFSLSVKSSRAKPIKAYIREILDDPAKPIYWGAARKGMQSSAQEIKYPWFANLTWNVCKYACICGAWFLDKLGVHKQFANRLLEAFLYVDQLVTGTDLAYNNFFALRCGLDGAADPNLQKIARMMARAYRDSTPQELSWYSENQWHLPFIDDDDHIEAAQSVDWKPIYSHDDAIALLCKVSAARCARLSYYEYGSDKRSSIDADLKLFDKLMNSGAPHASPTEHQSRPLLKDERSESSVSLGGNFGDGWVQFRKTIQNECQLSFDLEAITDEDYIIK